VRLSYLPTPIMSNLTPLGSHITEGEVPYDALHAGKPSKTWYKVVGDLSSGQTPVVALHGGPGGGHDYLLSLTDLWTQNGIPVVFYDQIGCGHSTHLPEKMGDEGFWTFDLFFRELENLLSHLAVNKYHLVGQSWGGILAAAYAITRPKGLKKLVISGGPASIPLYMKGVRTLLDALPDDVRKTLEDCDARGDHESPEFEAAAAVFYSRHVCRLDPYPDEVMATFVNLKKDPTAYLTMYVNATSNIDSCLYV
jgi:proline-specific peptidase